MARRAQLPGITVGLQVVRQDGIPKEIEVW
jgi:hypothetical protein